MEETGVPGENHRPVANNWQTLSHNVVSSTPRQRDKELYPWSYKQIVDHNVNGSKLLGFFF